MKLLIIENSQHLLRSLGAGLRKMGYAVDLVADGAEGLDYARFNEYDVIEVLICTLRKKNRRRRCRVDRADPARPRLLHRLKVRAS